MTRLKRRSRTATAVLLVFSVWVLAADVTDGWAMLLAGVLLAGWCVVQAYYQAALDAEAEVEYTRQLLHHHREAA